MYKIIYDELPDGKNRQVVSLRGIKRFSLFNAERLLEKLYELMSKYPEDLTKYRYHIELEEDMYV